MFYIFITLLLYQYFLIDTIAHKQTSSDNGQELLLCRKCGADVADSYYIFFKSSPGAKNIKTDNTFAKENITLQTLVNPFGIKFEIITLEKAKCENIGPRHSAESWFPGYTWRICACPHCGQHLGWTFEKSSDHNETQNESDVKLFYGIILSNILGENFTDSLIMMPNLYKM